MVVKEGEIIFVLIFNVEHENIMDMSLHRNGRVMGMAFHRDSEIIGM